MFNQLKRTQSEAPCESDSKKSKPAVEKKKLNMYNPWDQTTLSYDTVTNNHGDKTIQGMVGKWKVNVQSAWVSSKFSELSKEGNMGGDNRFNNTPSTAKFVLKIMKGLPEHITSKCPEQCEINDNFFSHLDKEVEKMLTAAYNDSDVLASVKKKSNAKAKKDGVDPLEFWLKNAENSLKKEWQDEDGNSHDLFVFGRKFQFTDNDTGEIKSLRPTFWVPKPVEEGKEQEFEQVDVDYISSGTVLIFQYQLRLFQMGKSYGVAGDLGPNIVIVYKKKKKTSGPKLSVPMFDDE
jgi:hypothetical protein